MMELDFIKVLRDETNKLNLDFVGALGYLTTAESMALYPLAGGTTIQEFYNGVKDKRLNFEFAIKTKNNLKAYNTLNQIGRFIDAEPILNSLNGSYTLNRIAVASEPTMIMQDTAGFFIYQLTIQAEMTLYEGVVMNG